MRYLLKAIRDTLVGDGTLTATVAAADIHITYNKKTANYPCIAFEVGDGDASNMSESVELDRIKILIFSNTDNQEAWDIHGLVKGLLHNQSLSISDTNVKIHSIQMEKKETENFLERYGTQGIAIVYKILYTEV